MVQQDRQCLWSTGVHIGSPARHSVLRIWRCCSCSVGCNCVLDLILAQELYMPWDGQKRNKKVKNFFFFFFFGCWGCSQVDYNLFFFFFFVFLGLLPRHMEVPRLGVQSELQLLAYTTAAAAWDLSKVCDLHLSSW